MTTQNIEQLVVEHEEEARSRYYGKYRGKVAENSPSSPNNRGMIKVLVPEVLGDRVSNWAMPCVPYAGEGVGQFMIPPVNAGVWVEFEAGDISRPIWSGCWWARDDFPEDASHTVADVPLKIIRTDKGLMVAFDDNSQTISLSDKNGRNVLEIKVQQGKITVKGATKAIVEAPQIELVENATHPVVFGDQLLQYLNQLVMLYQSHLHPGELALGIFPVTPAPPVPPFPTATPALLSTRVKTG